jgi:uncharacterized phage-associated protein
MLRLVTMARVDDVVALVLEQCGTITTFKLHKLLYYAQGWSLAWSGEVLFDAKIKAYEHGPVVSALFNDHRGQRYVNRWAGGDSAKLTDDERDTVLAVLERYGGKTPEELVELTHSERPWLDAWNGRESSAQEIPTSELMAFFTEQARVVPDPSPEARAMADRMRRYWSAADKPPRGGT